MAYRIEQNIQTGRPEIVIDGWERGIARSPFEGIGDIRNANISTSPKELSVMFSTLPLTLPPSGYSEASFSAESSTDIITVSSTAGFYVGMGLRIVSVSGAGGLTAGRTYYVRDITATTFKLYTNTGTDSLIDITVNITGTFTVDTFGRPMDYTSVNFQTVSVENDSAVLGGGLLVLTHDGLVWFIKTGAGVNPPAYTVQSLGNIGHSTAGSYQVGIAEFNGYVFVFYNTAIDYIAVDNFLPFGNVNPSASWVVAWQSITASGMGHKALAATDDALYFCNGKKVGSILVNAGETFNPASSSTYTYNATALALPPYDIAKCLVQLGTNLLVGGSLNYIYPWDRVSPSFNYPLICSENNIKVMVSSNSNTYVFAGNRGKIYITNGANIEEFKKFPDSLSNTEEPYYFWNDAIYHKNKLYFSLYCKDINGNTISNFAGLWSLDLSDDTLKLSNMPSYGLYSGVVTIIMRINLFTPPGDGLIFGWINASNVGGMDRTQNDPYTDYFTIVESDIIPVGTFLNKATFSNTQFKLGKKLVANEGIRLFWRSNLNESWTLLGTTETAGLLSDLYPVNFQGVEWLQLKAELKSTATNPSYVQLRELRVA